jgi:hypothetical protein
MDSFAVLLPMLGYSSMCETEFELMSHAHVNAITVEYVFL